VSPAASKDRPSFRCTIRIRGSILEGRVATLSRHPCLGGGRVRGGVLTHQRWPPTIVLSEPTPRDVVAGNRDGRDLASHIARRAPSMRYFSPLLDSGAIPRPHVSVRDRYSRETRREMRAMNQTPLPLSLQDAPPALAGPIAASRVWLVLCAVCLSVLHNAIARPQKKVSTNNLDCSPLLQGPRLARV
jgi:hypothetical protein